MPTVPGVIAIAFEENAVGKTISDTKMRTTWRLQVNGSEREIELTNSRISRRKKLFVDQKCIHEDTSFFGSFTFTWRMNQFAFAILPNAKETGYDLFINDVSFFDLLPLRSARPSSRQASRLQLDEERESLEIQRAIELSLRDEAKRATVQPPAPVVAPNKPVIVRDLISFDDAPAAPPRPLTPVVVLPDQLFTQQPHQHETFELSAGSPNENPRKSVDPIMDWFQEQPQKE